MIVNLSLGPISFTQRVAGVTDLTETGKGRLLELLTFPRGCLLSPEELAERARLVVWVGIDCAPRGAIRSALLGGPLPLWFIKPLHDALVEVQIEPLYATEELPSLVLNDEGYLSQKSGPVPAAQFVRPT